MKNRILIVALLMISVSSLAGNVGLFFLAKESMAREANLAWVINENANAYDLEQEKKDDIANWLMQNNKRLTAFTAQQLADTMYMASQHYNVSIDIVKRVMMKESAVAHITPGGARKRFYPCSYTGEVVRSCRGAIGAMQVMPFWSKACPQANKISDLYDANVNIWCGVYVLSHYRSEFRSVDSMLTAYNGGPPAVREKARGRDITNGYAAKVMSMKI